MPGHYGGGSKPSKKKTAKKMTAEQKRKAALERLKKLRMKR